MKDPTINGGQHGKHQPADQRCVTLTGSKYAYMLLTAGGG